MPARSPLRVSAEDDRLRPADPATLWKRVVRAWQRAVVRRARTSVAIWDAAVHHRTHRSRTVRR